MSNPTHRPSAAEMLLKIDGRLNIIETKIDTLSDHEDRIRALERHRYQTAWFTTLGTALLTTVLVTLITQAIGN